uniref:Uncharacterized protein n=1 Tax=Schistosoma japonicum TaxID=6182 RepID=C1LJA0_SCHJA|nr:hypothetical protein [Schistosoma japonicum]
MSSSSLLYINVLLLVLIHSSIQIASPTSVFSEVTKVFTELQENILKFIGNIGGKDNFQKRLTNDAIRKAEKRINDLEVVNLGKILKFIGNIEDKDDLHKRLTDDAISNVESRIDELQKRKKRLSGYIKERPYDLQQEINKLKIVNPQEKEILNQYVVCYGKYRTRLQRQWAIRYLGKFRDEMAKDFPNYSANVLEEVNRCGVTLEQFFTELESKENHTSCTEPKNIKVKDLRNLQLIIFDQKTDLVDINVYECKIYGTLEHYR